MAVGEANTGLSLQRQQTKRNRLAVGYMFLAIICASLSPLVISVSGASESPFLFNGGWRLGTLVAYLMFLAAFYSPLLRNRETLSLIVRRTFSWTMLIIVIVNFDFALFVWSTQFIDISVAAILFEIWPIILIFLMLRLLKEEGRYRRITLGMFLMLAVSFIGFVFVVLSQEGAKGIVDSSSSMNLAIGIGLVLAAAIAASLTAFSFKWGSDLSKELPGGDDGEEKESVELFSIVTAFVIGNLIAAPITTSVGLIQGETLSFKMIGIGVVGGVFINAVSSILWRKSNLITNNLGVNALGYAAPILALVWLALFSLVDVIRPDYLIVGTAAIITANLLINFEAEVRIGFKSLLVALWTCGLFVLLRDDILLNNGDFLWTGASYFGALTLAATIFTLIMSFRVARLVSRTTDEENRQFALFQRLDLLAKRNVISDDIRESILRIDVSEQRPEELASAYNEAMRYITEASVATQNDTDRQSLSEAEAELNSLVHSKQHGLVFGELFALYIFAGICVLITLLSKPVVTGWTAFLIDMFAMLFASVIIFLIFNVHDLQQERILPSLQRRKAQFDRYEVLFRDARTRAFEQSISIAAATVIILGYAGLLLDKWEIYDWL